MFDAYGSYNEGLILMGVFIAVSGIMLYPIPCIRKTLEKVNRYTATFFRSDRISSFYIVKR